MDEKKQFTSEQLEAALMFAMDTFMDAGMEFFAMGSTAENIYNNEWLTGDKVQLGIKKSELMPGSIDILKISNPSIDVGDRKIIMEYEGVPIEVRIIKKHYRVLDNLDIVMYAYEQFFLPTPFDAFLRMERFMH